MHRRILRRFLIVLAATGAAIVVAIAFRPKPTEVETARVTRGPLQVTIDEDGETRAHDRFTLAAWIGGASRAFAFMKAMRSGQTLFLQPLAPCRLTRGNWAKSARASTLLKLAGVKRASS